MVALRQHLGTLTQISVVPVSAQSLIARRPFPRVYTGRHFGVCERDEDFTLRSSRAVLYTPTLLVADYPVRYFGRNERCPRSFGFLPLGQSHRNELHVKNPFDLHAPLETLHRAPVKIAWLRVLPPRLRTGCSILSLAAHPSGDGTSHAAVCSNPGRSGQLLDHWFPCACSPCGASTRRENKLPRP